MGPIKFFSVFICLILYFIIGNILRIALFWTKPEIRIKTVNVCTQFLMHMFTTIGNIKIKVEGEKDVFKEKGLFIICTHVGYLDGVILGTLVPGSFTTKMEIKKVPVLGAVVATGESIFVERGKKKHIINYINTMCERLTKGINVFCFPEGHASNGTKILPFFSAFFGAPLKSKAPIVPVTIEYQKVNGSSTFNRSDVYCYDGNISILKHLWYFLKLKRVDVTITIHEIIQPNDGQINSKIRKETSELCISRLSGYKNLPISEEHPLTNPQTT